MSVAERARGWRAKNPEHAKAYKKAWRLNNIDRVRAVERARRIRGLDRIRATCRAWMAKNRNLAKDLAYNASRRALRRKVTVGDLTAIAKVYERAKWWKQWFNVHVDHVIPLTKNGTHEASNLQIIYAHENLQKYTNLNYKPRVIFL